MLGDCCIILAAGDGKRMKSEKPKVLCEVLFKPMISWVVDACTAAGIQRGCVVTGKNAGAISPLLPQSFDTVPQEERLGTGHAASMAARWIREGGYQNVLVLYGDMPFVDPEDLKASHAAHLGSGNAMTLFSAEMDDPTGYGRLIMRDGAVQAIVEEKDADAETKKIKQMNTGIYWFQAAFLLDFFENMRNDNVQGEYYLTDSVGHAVANGQRAGIFAVSVKSSLGANDRKSLAHLNATARMEVIGRLREDGVDIPFTDGVVIGPDVTVGPDTTVLPGSVLRGKTHVGKGCEIGPNSVLRDALIGDGCLITASFVDSSRVRDGARIGPMTNIRPDCDIGPGAKIGDFVEVKNSTVGAETSLAHLTYIGDSDLGAGCNVGCGVVTVNYDGSNKHRTVVGDDAFIGCNCNLIAPVTLGDRVYAAAGTTITKDVPEDAMVIGRARETVKEGWARDRGLFPKKRKDG